MGVCGQYVLMQTLFMNRIEDFMKKIFRQIHLWLSVPFGLIISLICFSGAMLVFENDFPEPGVPRISPFGFLSFFLSTMIMLLLSAFNP